MYLNFCALVLLCSFGVGHSISCYKCATVTFMIDDEHGPCYDGDVKNLTTWECKQDEICMKYHYDAGGVHLMERDCAGPKETCDQFRIRKEKETNMAMGSPGTMSCHTCHTDKCNSSHMIRSPSVLIVITCLIFFTRFLTVWK